eukprot:528496-Amorphochlora_amoeboformis.AAC.1
MEIARLLLESKAKLAASASKHEPFLYACNLGRLTVVQYYLVKVKLNAKAVDGHPTCIISSAWHDYQQVLRTTQMMSASSGYGPLHNAVFGAGCLDGKVPDGQ